ncbi:MAG: metallophosphoesterase family protein [Eubacterium sp.]
MKEKLEKFLFSKTSLSVFTVISAVGLLLSYSVRYGYVYVDDVFFNNASFAFYILSIISTAFLFVLLCMNIKDKARMKSKWMMFLTFICELIGILLVLYTVVTIAVDRGMSLPTFNYLMVKALPVWCAAVAGAFFIFIFPNLKSIKTKKVISVISVCALVFVTYASLFPVSPYSFTSGPVVFDNGNGGYSVVFSTNDKGTGYIEYTYNGTDIRLYDENNGRKNGQSKIHTVVIPKEQLSGNTYKIGSTRVIDELSYGGRLGKTIESEAYTLNDSFGENINVLSVSDWHTFNKKAETAVDKLGEDYQAVVLLGDCAPGLMSETDVINYILKFGYDLTQGEMPIIYTRGNHETRGRQAIKLADYLGMDSFYYTTDLGDYDIIVLDSCEDKEDSHPEYGGMVDYTQYRTNMVNWLNSVDDEDYDKTIVLSHDEKICIEEDLSASAMNKIDSINASLLVSGHEHIYNFDDSGTIPTLLDGGIDANGTGSFVASLIKLSPQEIGIVCTDNNGNNVVNETLEWKK